MAIGTTAAILGAAALGIGGTLYATNQASKDIRHATDVSASESAQNVQASREALNYLKEVEALPREIREGALTKLAGIYDLSGGDGDQQEFIDLAKNSPLFSAIMSTRDEGEEAILRSASATGGLRSGNVQDALYGFNTDLSTEALLESYNQQVSGISGLAGLPSHAPQIAQIGARTDYRSDTTAGMIAAARVKQQGFGNALGIGMESIEALA